MASPEKGLAESRPVRGEQSSSSVCGVLTPGECCMLSEAVGDFVYNQYKALRDTSQLFLMELACSKESVLSAEVERQGLRAARCSVWNGFDLATVAGVKKSLRFLLDERPEHLWVATECTAFSPMQNLNQRDPGQKERLAVKRREQRLQHVGAMIVTRFAHALGVTVHWEWSRRCRAWKWKQVEEFRQTCGTHTAVISCCQVNVRDSEGKHLLGKEWRIESSSSTFAKAVHLPCPGDHCRKSHAHAEGKDVTKTALYSPEFARRVVFHMLRDDQNNPERPEKCQSQQEYQQLMGVDWGECQCFRFREDTSELLCPKCLGMSLESPEIHAVVRKDPKEPYTKVERDRVLKQLHHLHRATGHGPYDHLVKSLEARKADPRVVELAREFRCSTCEERKKPVPRRLANLEVNTEKCKIVQMDAAHWAPESQDNRNKCQFMVFVDEASRFAVAKLFRKDGGGHVTAKDITSAFHEVWEPCFGVPEVLRADPDGACRSKELDLHFQQLGIETDNIPADAHWKISVVERAIQWIKELMSKCASEHPEFTHEAILAQAVRTWNQREPVRGYSPFQWMMGKAPDFEDRMFVPNVQKLPGSLLHHPEGGLHRSEALRICSEKSFIDWQYGEKLSRARNSRVKDYRMYQPGDLVYFWRLQGKNRQGNGTGLRRGAYAGPARVLAMESKFRDGQIMPGSAVWLIRGLRLVKVSVEQLRPATERETLVHELSQPQPELPWTITKLAEELGPHDYDDVTKDGAPGPLQDPEEVEDMEDSEPELIPAEPHSPEEPGDLTRHRVRFKRPQHMQPHSGRRGVPPTHRALTVTDEAMHLPREEAWHAQVHPTKWSKGKNAYWLNLNHAVEIAADLPTSKNKMEQFLRDPTQFFIKSLKRKTIEVSEKRMTASEREGFSGAKSVEVRKFLGAKAFEALPPGLVPDKEQALRMRWILTYKQTEDGGTKPKARAVILGFQDPEYANRPTFAPTMTRTSRQLLLQYSAWKGMTCWKGDVSGAFLQGREYQRQLQVLPVPEICQGMGLPAGSVCRLRKACYGLVEAPIEWFETVNSFLQSLGYRQLRSDPCTWIYTEEGRAISLISGHVDDFLFSGFPGCPTWERLRKAIQEKFEWQEWEENEFTQCGVRVHRLPDGSFHLDQHQYVEGIPAINIPRERRRSKHEPTTEQEKSQLRALYGALSWHTGQVGYKYSAHVGLGLSEIPQSTVEHLEQANKLLLAVKQDSKIPLKIHSFTEVTNLVMVAWTDASSQNRHDGSSTEGIIIGATPEGICEGAVSKVSPVFWRSGKIERTCRSPGAAEARAAVDAEDSLYLLRYAWAEFCGHESSVWEPDSHVKRVMGVLVTDSRNVYDRMDKPYVTPKGASKRVDSELLALKESQNQTDLVVRWVHSDAQLANTLTKRGEEHQVNRFIAMNQQWRIVDDPNMFSGKKRKAKGLDPLQNSDGIACEAPKESSHAGGHAS